MNVVILGAGASKSYQDSLTKERMPIATDFFSTFNKLNISKNTWVLVGYILNYLKRYHKLSFDDFTEYNENIEDLHSEIEMKLIEAFKYSKDGFHDINSLLICSTYVQLIFLFASVINEIQNGPVSLSHIKLSQTLSPDDVVITFNWDTLMDRALKSVTSWITDTGYFVSPNKIYKDEWKSCIKENKRDSPYLIKLHGSTNWLTSYMIVKEGAFMLTQELSPEEFFVYESTIRPYNTYDGRFMEGYNDFSYGYYPPNLPLKGAPLPDGRVLVRQLIRTPFNQKGISEDIGLAAMPLIIPPVKDKKYGFFGVLFQKLWDKAKDSIINADKIIIIGYSFPKTDIRTDELFKHAFIKRNTVPKIILINPVPDPITEKLTFEYGIPIDSIKVYKEYFNQNFDFGKL